MALQGFPRPSATPRFPIPNFPFSNHLTRAFGVMPRSCPMRSAEYRGYGVLNP